MKHHDHVRHLKRHRNVLYGIVMLLLIMQIITFVFVSSQTARIIADQERVRGELQNYIDSSRQENQYKIDQITDIISDQKTDIQEEINLLKATQEDFSGVIDSVIRGVVNIRTDRSAGTGFIVTTDGYVVTNYHIIQNVEYVKVQTYNGQTYDATLIGVDEVADVALLKIPGVFNKLELEETDNVEVGEKVIAIGNPLGLSFTVTEGIVSAVDRVGPNGQPVYIQTDVTLNPGNSGGPLIDKEGKVIGVNNFKIGGAESLGFALESDVVKEVANILAGEEII